MPQGRRRRGRGRGRRWITEIPETTHFIPHGKPGMDMKTIWITYAELEALRLVDLEGLHQDEAALEMGVSRKTLWNELKSARKKVAMALINGYAIRIVGGDYILRGEMR